MGNITIVILLLTIVTALAEVADRIKIPYPILLVLVGIGVSLIPGLPVITLSPDVVFLLFLPPVLYSAAGQPRGQISKQQVEQLVCSP
ncbi:MAG: hypothetical protein QM734_17720 [Cyclobacteriaceae bacterium]